MVPEMILKWCLMYPDHELDLGRPGGLLSVTPGRDSLRFFTVQGPGTVKEINPLHP